MAREGEGRALPHGSVVDIAHITLLPRSVLPGWLRHASM